MIEREKRGRKHGPTDKSKVRECKDCGYTLPLDKEHWKWGKTSKHPRKGAAIGGRCKDCNRKRERVLREDRKTNTRLHNVEVIQSEFATLSEILEDLGGMEEPEISGPVDKIRRATEALKALI